ncbi:hypothetical protein EVAR_12354_1 [Eumeta japonica]|uniref:Uncharacterized protein n=1 Tax=Eumeta variegata TaxID=151549 RepID=A0A4C1X332_EUMVA|nr:hypothetical protein EVAR_12354_1 [Eumeta japonica]
MLGPSNRFCEIFSFGASPERFRQRFSQIGQTEFGRRFRQTVARVPPRTRAAPRPRSGKRRPLRTSFHSYKNIRTCGSSLYKIEVYRRP